MSLWMAAMVISSCRGGLCTPSLRANGSRECAPDDRLREAIHRAAGYGLDCFVASLLAMTAVSAGAMRSYLRTNRLDIVPVGIHQERREIARAVIGPRAPPPVVAASAFDSPLIRCLDRGL